MKSEWPISKEAISLAWEAISNKAPFALQSIFQNAFNELITAYDHEYDEWFNSDIVIQERQMAKVIEIAIGRAESGIRFGEKEFEHKIKILMDEERYLTIPPGNIEKEKTIVRFMRDLIEESGFITEESGHISNKLYFLNVEEPINNEKQSLGFFIALDQVISERDITSLNEYVTIGLRKIRPRYFIVITNKEECREVYYGIGGPRREFTQICHLGNYTYVIQLADNQIDNICATYEQKDREYYKALLKIIDKRCCANIGLSLSGILKAIIYATFER